MKIMEPKLLYFQLTSGLQVAGNGRNKLYIAGRSLVFLLDKSDIYQDYSSIQICYEAKRLSPTRNGGGSVDG
jgi:hypothetical protein